MTQRKRNVTLLTDAGAADAPLRHTAGAIASLVASKSIGGKRAFL